MSFTAPHFNLPFRLRKTADCVEQDTVEDIANSVELLLRTHTGARAEAPSFGVSDYTFKLEPLDVDAIRDEIVAAEPRALVLITERPDVLDNLIDRITVEIRTGGGQ